VCGSIELARISKSQDKAAVAQPATDRVAALAILTMDQQAAHIGFAYLG